MTTAFVIDASAAVEIVAPTSIGTELQHLLPRQAVPWIPTASSTLMSVLTPTMGAARDVDAHAGRGRNASRHRWRLRRAAVSSLTAEAWTMRHNVTFTDACYVSLARRLDAPVLTSD